jgi:hypothetical protein
MGEMQILRLEVRVDQLEKHTDEIRRDLRDLYGLLKELAGRVAADLQFENLAKQLAEIRQDNIAQTMSIGEIKGTIQAIIRAMATSGEKRLASAAQSITINVEGDVDSLNTVEGDGNEFKGP